MDPMLELAGGLRRAQDSVTIAISELKGPFGVADLVVVISRDDTLRGRLEAGVPPLLNQIDALITAALNKRQGLSTGELSAAIRVGASVVERRVAALRRLGAVRARGDAWQVDTRLKPLGRTYSFEAKSTDWRGGLDQARRYQLWTNAATLVLDRLPGTTDVLMARCRDRGLGLAERGSWLVRPCVQQREQGMAMWGSEYVVAGMLGRRPALADHESVKPMSKRLHPPIPAKLKVGEKAHVVEISSRGGVGAE